VAPQIIAEVRARLSRPQDITLRQDFAKFVIWLLHRQLARRFGPLPDWIESKLTGVIEADLVRWGEAYV